MPPSIRRNAGSLLVAQITAKVVGLAFSIYVVRRLSPGEYGFYVSAMAVVAILGGLSDLGMTTWTIRRMSNDQTHHRRIFDEVLGAQLLTSAGFVLVLPLVLVSLTLPARTVELALLAGVTLFTLGAQSTVNALLMSFQRAGWSGLLGLLGFVSQAAFGLPFVIAGYGARGLVFGTLLGAAFSATAGIVLVRRLYGFWPRPRLSLPMVRTILGQSAPLALTSMFLVVYFRVDMVILAHLKGPADVARYSVAYRLMEHLLVLPTVVGAVMFPRLASADAGDARRARDELHRASGILFAVAIPLAIGGAFVSTDVMRLLFGRRYASSGLTFTILTFALVWLFQSYLLWYALVTARAERRFLGFAAALMVINIAANLLVVPHFSYNGAAAVMVGTEVLKWLGGLWYVRRHAFSFPLVSALVRPALAGLGMLAIVAALAGLNAFVAAGVGAAVFVLGLWSLRFVAWAPLER